MDQQKYENSVDGFAVMGSGILGMYYQMFNGVDPDKYKVMILTKNAETGAVFGSIVYPDALN